MTPRWYHIPLPSASHPICGAEIGRFVVKQGAIQLRGLAKRRANW
jgi:hypothetical protein